MIIVGYIFFHIARWFVLPKIRIFPYIYPEFIWVNLYNLFLALSHQVFGYILMFLLIMYVIWLIIKWFIPNFPLPFKKILLRLPPIYQLEKSGIFGLMDGVRKTIISNDRLNRRLARVGYSISQFLIRSSAFMGKGLHDMGVPVPIAQDTTRSATMDDGKSAFTQEEEAKANDEVAQCLEENTLPIFPEMSGVEKAKITLQNATTEIKCKAKSINAFSNILATRI